MKNAMLQVGLWLTLACHLHAQPVARLYAVTYYAPQFIEVNTNSGAGTLITNLPVNPYDIAVTEGALWLLAGGATERLLQIDAWSGAILTQKSLASSIEGGEGAMDFSLDGSAIASKSSDNVGTLFRFALTSTNVTAITSNGGLRPSLDGLAFDSQGILYGLSQNAGGFTLYLVNTNTGTTTPVGSLGITFPGTGGAVAGLAFAPDGTLWAAAGNPTESRLYRINKFSGAATLVGSVGYSGVSGIRFFVPPPGPLTISRVDQQVRLSWPHLHGGVLETAPTVKGIWERTTLPLITNGAEAVTLVAPTNSNQFFRLVVE